MAKLDTNDFFKATVDNLFFYRYGDMMVVRTASGFTKETRTTNPKYENCTRSANEFGRVSSLCKQVRLALSGILPKQNNRPVMYSFTKKMRQVLEQDTTNARGERQLSNALATEQGRQMLKGYEFNPDTTIKLEYTLHEDSLTVNTDKIKFPKGINNLGFRLHQLAFDFATGENSLVSGEWVVESGEVVLGLPGLGDVNGVRFVILEAGYFDFVDGEFVAVVEDGGKSVGVVGVG